jgi:hypothetical protein
VNSILRRPPPTSARRRCCGSAGSAELAERAARALHFHRPLPEGLR